MHEVLCVLTHCPDEESAQRIARALVENQLAACVNRHGPVRSVYRWQGRIEEAYEVALVIKTTRARYPALEQAIRQLHPYETPEIVALPLAAGYGPYLRWVADSTPDPQSFIA
ncbi:MAG TPA: divalent-cation tolerance protein CutA [Burkholderiaceae bacterium]|nr:divalent-cation tolerance protein CutA [Burkholderiaceae bacterium]